MTTLGDIAKWSNPLVGLGIEGANRVGGTDILNGTPKQPTTPPYSGSPRSPWWGPGVAGAGGAATSAVDQFGVNVNKAVTAANAPPSPYDMSKPGTGETGATAASNLLMQPGASEQNWDATKGQWGKPLQDEQYWNSVAGKFQGGGPAVSNNAQGAYDAYMKSMPSISPTANFGAFYDNASKRFGQDANTQLGARGAFNSSAALDKIAQGQGSIRADEAKANAQYGLDRAAALTNEAAVGGNLASGADTSSMNQAKTSLDYLTEGGKLATSAGDSTLSRLTGGQNAANSADSARTNRLTAAATASLGAQGAHDQRIQTAFNQISGLDTKLQGVATDAYSKILNGDQALMDAVMSGKIANVSEALHISTADANQLIGSLQSLAQASAAVKGGMPSGGTAAPSPTKGGVYPVGK